MVDPEADVDGFFIGMYETDGISGDAWIWAPDARIAFLKWSTGAETSFVETPDSVRGTRWGNYTVQLPMPLTTDQQAQEFLSLLLPELRRRWTEWRDDPQPVFSRYQAAWHAYQAAQPEPPAEAIPYMRAAATSPDSGLLAAADELRLARDAWHSDQNG